MEIRNKAEAAVTRVQEKFATEVAGSAQSFALAVRVLAGLRGSGKAGGVLETASKNVELTRAAIHTVLKERFAGLMTHGELDTMKGAVVGIEKAQSQLESLAFAPGVVIQSDRMQLPAQRQAEDMKLEASASGQTYGRVVDGRPLVVGPSADIDAAIKAWKDAPEIAKTPEHSVGGRLSAERQRTLTAQMEQELKDPGDQAMWSLMTATFPGMYVNQRDNGGYYVSLPEALESTALVGRTGDGATLQDAFNAAKTAMTNPQATWVIDAYSKENRRELQWAPAWNTWAPRGSTRTAEPKALAGTDATQWQATKSTFPGARVMQRTDGSFYVTGLPERHVLGAFRGISGNGSTAEAAVKASLELLTKRHERLATDMAGKHDVTFKDGAFRPWESTLREEVAEAVKKAGDARVAAEVLKEVMFPDVKMKLIAEIGVTTPHRQETLTKAAAQVLLETIRQSGDFAGATRYFDSLLEALTEQTKKSALALALAEKPGSRSLLAYQAQLQSTA